MHISRRTGEGQPADPTAVETRRRFRGRVARSPHLASARSGEGPGQVGEVVEPNREAIKPTRLGGYDIPELPSAVTRTASDRHRVDSARPGADSAKVRKVPHH